MSTKADMEIFYNKLRQHPLAQKIESDAAKELLKQRQAAAKQILRLQEAQAIEISELRSVEAAKKAAFLEAEKACREAESEWNKAFDRTFGASISYGKLIAEQEAFLRNTSDQILDDAIRFFNEKLTWLRSSGRQNSQEFSKGINPVTLRKRSVFINNRDSILKAIEYCRDSIRKIENMKLTPKSDPIWLESLKAGIPSIDDYTEPTRA